MTEIRYLSSIRGLLRLRKLRGFSITTLFNIPLSATTRELEWAHHRRPLLSPSSWQRVKQGSSFYSFEFPCFLHHLKKPVSSLLRLKQNKAKGLGHGTEPVNIGVARGANLLVEDPSVHLTSWGGEFLGKACLSSATLTPVQGTSLPSPLFF